MVDEKVRELAVVSLNGEENLEKKTKKLKIEIKLLQTVLQGEKEEHSKTKEQLT